MLRKNDGVRPQNTVLESGCRRASQFLGRGSIKQWAVTTIPGAFQDVNGRWHVVQVTHNGAQGRTRGAREDQVTEGGQREQGGGMMCMDRTEEKPARVEVIISITKTPPTLQPKRGTAGPEVAEGGGARTTRLPFGWRASEVSKPGSRPRPCLSTPSVARQGRVGRTSKRGRGGRGRNRRRGRVEKAMSLPEGAVTQGQCCRVHVRHSAGKGIPSKEERETVERQFVGTSDVWAKLFPETVSRDEGEWGAIALEEKGQVKDA